MPLDERFSFGEKIPQELVVQLSRMYDDIASEVNAKSSFIIMQAAPTGSDIDYPQGQKWIDEVANRIYVLTSKTATVATWVEIT